MKKVEYTDDELREMMNPASEELRQALNGILSRHKLEPAALFVLARITAAYIHQMQQVYEAAGYDEVIEELYRQISPTFNFQCVIKQIANMKRVFFF